MKRFIQVGALAIVPFGTSDRPSLPNFVTPHKKLHRPTQCYVNSLCLIGETEFLFSFLSDLMGFLNIYMNLIAWIAGQTKWSLQIWNEIGTKLVSWFNNDALYEGYLTIGSNREATINSYFEGPQEMNFRDGIKALEHLLDEVHWNWERLEE